MKFVLERYEKLRPFTDDEAWLLFRIAAIAEACGWTLLIAGILIERYLTPGNNTAILIAGNLHGTIYLVYFAAALVLYPSLGWSRWNGFAALLAGVPPYGSLLFEMWMAHKRRDTGFKTYRHYLVYNVLIGT